MKRHDKQYQTYVDILKKELVPSMGCTEPTSLALCAATARSVLGKLPQKVEIEASGNIIKNVKSVIVPNTNGKKGMEAAAAIGIVAGNEKLGLEVLQNVTKKQKQEFVQYLDNTEFYVKQAESDLLLDIIVRVYSEDESAVVRIANAHANVVYIEKNGQVILNKEVETQNQTELLNYQLLSVMGIYEFAQMVNLDEISDVIERQIQYNSIISEEGLKEDYGANIGSVILSVYDNEVRTRAKAKAAAGSDARMNGCECPVVINSGSGNQGMAVSLPVIEYAKELDIGKDKLYRALIISNLTAIHQKTGIAYLRGGEYGEIAHTIINALAITSGIICDGAKASCAAKIATAVDAGIFGYEMYLQGQQFYSGEGVVSDSVENTIKNIGRLGKNGMRDTDKEILCIMTCVD
ncbi:MAG: serine dehydratase subunit alpha family protein [Anaerostipes sp.]